MTRVVWTRPARDDLHEIRAYIAQGSERYARVVAALGRGRRLRKYPLSGRVVPNSLSRQSAR